MMPSGPGGGAGPPMMRGAAPFGSFMSPGFSAAGQQQAPPSSDMPLSPDAPLSPDDEDGSGGGAAQFLTAPGGSMMSMEEQMNVSKDSSDLSPELTIVENE